MLYDQLSYVQVEVSNAGDSLVASTATRCAAIAVEKMATQLQKAVIPSCSSRNQNNGGSADTVYTFPQCLGISINSKFKFILFTVLNIDIEIYV
jgi:hypothetical protein